MPVFLPRPPLTTTVVSQITPRFAAALLEPHVVARRAEVWSGTTLLGAFYIDPSTTLTVDRNAAYRRSGTVLLTEGYRLDGGVVVPPVGSPDWFAPYGNEVKLYRGITYSNGDVELVQTCVCGIEERRVTDTPQDLVVTLTVNDRARAVERAGFTDDYTIAPGTNITAAIRALIGSRSTGLTFTFNFFTTTATTGLTSIVYHAGDDPWQKATELAQSAGMEVFFDRLGNCTLIPVPDPKVAPVDWSYEEGPQMIGEKIDRLSSRTKAANYIIREGMGTGIVNVKAIAQDLNPNSPTFVGGKYGRVVDRQQSNLYATQGQAQAAANADLLLAQGTVESLTLDAIPKPDHDVDDVIEVTRARSGLAGSLYVLDSFTMGFASTDVLTASGRSVVGTAS